MPRMPQYIVPLKIRDQVILVRNQANALEMAFKPGEEMEGLSWLMEQLQDGFSNVQKTSRPLEDAESDEVDEDEEGEEHEAHCYPVMEKQMIKKVVQNLKEHEKCKNASWCPSKVALKVVRKDKSVKWLRITELNKRRKVAAEAEHENMALFEPV